MFTFPKRHTLFFGTIVFGQEVDQIKIDKVLAQVQSSRPEEEWITCEFVRKNDVNMISFGYISVDTRSRELAQDDLEDNIRIGMGATPYCSLKNIGVPELYTWARKVKQ